MPPDQIADAGTTQNTGDATAAAPTAPVATTALTDGATATTQQATEGQPAPAGDKPADASNTEADSAKAEGDKPVGAPESYEFKAPEGITLDAEVIGEFSTVAKELGLSQEAAQAIVEKLAPKLAERTAAQQAEAFKVYRTGLVEQVKTDKEFGGEKLSENLAVAKKALDAFGTPELRTLLNDSGLGDHPEIIRAFYRAGKAISEDTFVPGSTQPTKGETNAANKLYGKKQ